MMSQAQLYSAEVAQDTLESLFAAHGPQRSYIYWTVLLGVIASLVALPLVKVDVSVRAQGMVRPRTERTELKSAVSGHTTQVRARDNDTVKAGQPLLILRTVEVEERIARNHAHQAERREAIVDLEWLVSPGPAEAGIGGRTFSTSQYRQEFAQLQAQLGRRYDPNNVATMQSDLSGAYWDAAWSNVSIGSSTPVTFSVNSNGGTASISREVSIGDGFWGNMFNALDSGINSFFSWVGSLFRS